MWVSNRSDLAALLGSLGTCWAARRFVSTQRFRWLLAGVAALGFGLGAKEVAIAVIPVIVGAAVYSSAADRRSIGSFILTLCCVAGAWAIWRSAITANSVHISHGLTTIERLALATRVHLEYGFELLVPYELRVCDASRAPTHSWLFAVLGLGLGSLIAVGVNRARRLDDRALAIAIVWSVAFLLPTSGIVEMKHVRADRYLYCALPGLILLAVSKGSRLLEGPRRQVIARWTVGATCAYLVTCLLARADRLTRKAHCGAGN